MQASVETQQTETVVVWSGVWCLKCLKYTVVAGTALSWLYCHDELQDPLHLQPGQDSGPAGSEDQEPRQVSPVCQSLLSPLLAVTLQRLPDQGQPSLRLQPRGEQRVRPKSARPRPSVPG